MMPLRPPRPVANAVVCVFPLCQARVRQFRSIERASATNGFSLEVPEDLSEYLQPDEEWYEPCWNVEDLVTRNREARTLDLIPTHLLAFGDSGADEWFCVDTRSNTDQTVYAWYVIAQEDTRMAPDLPTFWDSWLSRA